MKHLCALLAFLFIVPYAHAGVYVKRFPTDTPVKVYEAPATQPTSGNCAQFDANGNPADSGSACGGAGASPGGNNGEAQYNGSGSFTGLPRSVMTSGGNVGLGTTTTPASTLSVSTNSTTDPFRVSGSGSVAGNRFIITNAGNVGIGSSAPNGSGGLLTIGSTGAGAVSLTRLVLQNPNFQGPWNFITRDTASRAYLDMIYSGSPSAFTLANGGNVGIDATAPDTGGQLTIGNGSEGAVGKVRLNIVNPNFGNGYFFTATDTATASRMDMEYGSSGDGSLITLTSGRNVGIGSYSPGAKLDLTGDFRVSGTIDSALTAGRCVETTTNGVFTVAAGACGSGAGGGQWLTSNVGIGTYDNVGIGTVLPTAVLNITSSVAGNLFRVDDNAAGDLSPFVIDQNGNVGIGTANTETDKLLIMGGNVGIGTWVPNQALDVKGQVIISDNVGIGTILPNALLSVASTVAQTLLRVDDNAIGDPSPFLIDQNGNVGIGTTIADNAGVSIMNGNVGIGTWKPTQALTIGTGGQFTVAMANGNTVMGSLNTSGITNNGNETFTNGASIVGSATASSNLFITGGTSTTSTLTLRGTNSASGTTDRVIFQGRATEGATFANNSGTVNLGIGTFSPTAALEIGNPGQFKVTSTGGVTTLSTIELGAASDTTLARVSAGLVSIEGKNIVDVSTAQTLTTKTIIATSNVVEEITTVASDTTPDPTGGSLRNYYTLTALAGNATVSAPTGSPVDGNYLTMRILDNGTARTLAWNAIYRAGTTVTLPATTTLSKTMWVGFRYNSASSTWDLLAVDDGF